MNTHSIEIRVTRSKDAELVEDIMARLRENSGYCPCRAYKNEDTKCMCKDFREQIEAGKPGECHCGLYVITVQETGQEQ